MKWAIFLVVACVIAASGGLLGGYLLPMAGIEEGLARIIGFALAGAIIALLFLKFRSAPDT